MERMKNTGRKSSCGSDIGEIDGEYYKLNEYGYTVHCDYYGNETADYDNLKRNQEEQARRHNYKNTGMSQDEFYKAFSRKYPKISMVITVLMILFVIAIVRDFFVNFR